MGNSNNSGNQTASDEQCQACAGGQTWWPCNVEGLCHCAGSETTPAPETTEAPTVAPTTAVPTTTEPQTTQSTSTTEAPVTTDAPQPSGKCDSACTNCIAVPGNSQDASDAHCQPCGGSSNQQWWPCMNAGTDLGLCQCAGAAPTTTAQPDTTAAPETTVAPDTTGAPETTVAPDTTAAPETTVAPETTGAPSTDCSSGCQCVAIPGNGQGAIDTACEPCGRGQTWWPCNQPLCMCAGGPVPTPTTVAPDTTSHNS